MAEKYIKLHGELIAVTEEVYYTYYHMERQSRTQAEKDRRHRIASYDALDTNEGLGIELLTDEYAPGVEDTAIANILTEELHRCLRQLPVADRGLLHALFLRASQSGSVPKSLVSLKKQSINAVIRLLANCALS